MARNVKKASMVLPQEWFARDAVTVARDLLGKTMRYKECSGIIVETEAYALDEASHGRTRTKRSQLMRETYGYWYVYFTYGMHHCVNVTADADSVGAVLIRAVEPLEGIPLMQERRKVEDLRKLCSGPGKLCQAFGISTAENGLPVAGDFAIHDAPPIPDADVLAGPRIGIRHDTELPWRFSVKGSPYLSR